MKSIFNIFGKKDKLNANNPEAVKEYILNEGLPGLLEYPSRREGDSIIIDELDLSITPVMQQLTDKAVNLGFDMYCGKWDKYMYESSTGAGGDFRTAIGQSLSSFVFAFMRAFKWVADRDNPRECESEFAGNIHRWDVYVGDIVSFGSGEGNAPAKVSQYWDFLKEDIIKRLGNQRMVYIKIYAAKIGDSVVGECRIDDVPIPELGDQIASLVEKWGETDFASHKQFIFLEQRQETILPYPYSGKDGREKMKSAVIEYVKLFDKVDSQEAYDRLIDDAADKLGDRVLAMSCFHFLPEICAAHGYEEKLTVEDNARITMPDGRELSVHTSQLADFGMLSELIREIINEGILGDRQKNIYVGLISCSAISGTMEQVFEKEKEAGGEIGGLRLSELVFNMGEGYVLR